MCTGSEGFRGSRETSVVAVEVRNEKEEERGIRERKEKKRWRKEREVG